MSNDLIVEATRFKRRDFCEPHVGDYVTVRGSLLGFVGYPTNIDNPDRDVYAVYATVEGKIRADTIANCKIVQEGQ